MKVIFTRHTFHFYNRSGEFNDMYGIYEPSLMVVTIHVVQIGEGHIELKRTKIILDIIVN